MIIINSKIINNFMLLGFQHGIVSHSEGHVHQVYNWIHISNIEGIC